VAGHLHLSGPMALGFSLQGGQAPAILHSKHSDGDGHGAGEYGTTFWCPTEPMQATNIDQTSRQTTGGIDFLAEDEGHLVDKDVAHDTATGTRDTTEYDGRPGGEAKAQRLLDTDDVEEREADAVKEEPGVVLTHQQLAEDNDPDKTEETGSEVDGVFEPERGLANHQVTDGTTTAGRGRSDDEGSEEVELLGCCQTGTRDSARQGSYQFKDNERPGDTEHIAHLLEELLNEFHDYIARFYDYTYLSYCVVFTRE